MKNANKLASMPTIKRLPSYLHVIEAAEKEGKEFISGTVIADELELEPIQVRKDLAITGIVGKPRIGFPVHDLIAAINQFLRWDREHQAVVVGAGHLGTALIGYDELAQRGVRIRAAFDLDQQKVGKTVNNVPIYSLGKLSDTIQELNIDIAILSVPPSHAQAVADMIVKAGIRAIWNFTTVKLKLPLNVVVQKEDMSSGYAMLSVKMKHAFGEHD